MPCALRYRAGVYETTLCFDLPAGATTCALAADALKGLAGDTFTVRTTKPN